MRFREIFYVFEIFESSKHIVVNKILLSRLSHLLRSLRIFTYLSVSKVRWYSTQPSFVKPSRSHDGLILPSGFVLGLFQTFARLLRQFCRSRQAPSKNVIAMHVHLYDRFFILEAVIRNRRRTSAPLSPVHIPTPYQSHSTNPLTQTGSPKSCCPVRRSSMRGGVFETGPSLYFSRDRIFFSRYRWLRDPFDSVVSVVFTFVSRA